jgi:hypothetical protein
LAEHVLGKDGVKGSIPFSSFNIEETIPVRRKIILCVNLLNLNVRFVKEEIIIQPRIRKLIL